MKDFVKFIYENGMELEIPVEYSEYMNPNSGRIVYCDPEDEEQAAIAAKVKAKMLFMMTIVVVFLLIFTVVAVTDGNKTTAAILMCAFTALFIGFTVRIVCIKPQVAIGRAVIKTKQLRQGSGRKFSYHVAIAVDKPEKTIYSGINVSRKDYEIIQEGTQILVENITGNGRVFENS